MRDDDVLIGVRSGLRPLLAFRDELAGRAARELEPLDERRVPLELKPLVASLNALLARVRAAAEAQQKFVADAAHQLRTPLAGMQAQLELLERDADALPVRDRVRAVREGLKRDLQIDVYVTRGLPKFDAFVQAAAAANVS